MLFPMPRTTFDGRNVEEAALDMVVRVYREQYEAAHPLHETSVLGDQEILDLLASLDVTGGPQTSNIARYVATHDDIVPTPPVVTGLDPETAVIGDSSFTLRVLGSGFHPDDVIVFNGYDEPTTHVSDTELTTGVDMDVWTAPSAPLPVTVRNALGLVSAPVTFTFTAPVVADDPAEDCANA